MRAVNLLPRDDQQRSQKQQNVPAILSTAAIVLVTGLLGVLYFSAKSTATTKEMELQDAQAELAMLPTPAEIAAKTAPQRQLASEHSARVAALSSAFTYRVAWDRVLREMSLVLPEDVWLVELSGQSPQSAGAQPIPATPHGQPPQLMFLRGYTYSHDGVARFLTRLSVIPDLKNVWLERSERSLIAGRPVITFQVKADVRATGATS
jgi:Tfp pilus assembly protein PilN